MTEIPEQFIQWLHRKLEETNLSQTRASLRAGLNQNAISDLVNGKTQEVSIKTARGLARVFNTPLEEVLRMAGHMPISNDISLKELLEIAQMLNPDERADLLDYARWRLSKRTGEAEA